MKGGREKEIKKRDDDIGMFDIFVSRPKQQQAGWRVVSRSFLFFLIS